MPWTVTPPIINGYHTATLRPRYVSPNTANELAPGNMVIDQSTETTDVLDDDVDDDSSFSSQHDWRGMRDQLSPERSPLEETAVFDSVRNGEQLFITIGDQDASSPADGLLIRYDDLPQLIVRLLRNVHVRNLEGESLVMLSDLVQNVTLYQPLPW